MSIEEDLNSSPKPLRSPEERKYPIDVEKLSGEELDEIAEQIKARQLQLRQAAAGGTPPKGPAAEPNMDAVHENLIHDTNILGGRVAEMENARIAKENEGIKQKLEAQLADQLAAETDAPTREDSGAGVQTETRADTVARLLEENRQREAAESKEATLNSSAARSAEKEKLERMIANNISQEKMMDAANAQPEQPSSSAYDPSIIPPQTMPDQMNPAFENRNAESMLDTASRIGSKIAERVGEKIGDSMQYGFLGKLEPKLERLGIRILNAPRRLALEGLYRWRSEHATAAKADLDAAVKKVDEMKAKLAAEDAKRTGFIAAEQSAGNNIANISMKLEGERAKALERIRKAEMERDTKHAKLENLNGKKAHWENRQRDVARNMVDKVNGSPRVVGANADFIALTKYKENITNQLAQWESARTNAQAKLAQLEAQLTSAGSYVEEEDITGQIDTIKKILEEGNKKYKDYVGRKNAADTKMLKINNYLSGWNTFKNDLGRTGEDNRYEDGGPQAKVAVGTDRNPTMSNAPKV